MKKYITYISEKMENPGRMCVGHPFNPPHLIPLVEIVPGKSTSELTLNKTKEFYESLSKAPIILKKKLMVLWLIVYKQQYFKNV